MLRITGGEFRGRLLKTPRHQHTRPTQSRLRQALFNSLQHRIPDARVLDLFSGSGALGFEALSRGASQVVFVEEVRSTTQVIEANAQSLGVKDRIEIRTEAVDAFLARIQKERVRPFDLILADPPYEKGWENWLLNSFPWGELLSNEGIFCLEWGLRKSQVSELPERVPFLMKIREKNYGDSILTTYSKETEVLVRETQDEK